MSATDGTDGTIDEASDRPFDTQSFIINAKLLGGCFLFECSVNCYLFFVHLLYSKQMIRIRFVARH